MSEPEIRHDLWPAYLPLQRVCHQLQTLNSDHPNLPAQTVIVAAHAAAMHRLIKTLNIRDADQLGPVRKLLDETLGHLEATTTDDDVNLQASAIDRLRNLIKDRCRD